jgi:hypothetical protein
LVGYAWSRAVFIGLAFGIILKLDFCRKIWYNIYSTKGGEAMTREEKIELLIRAQQLPTYEEWYELNRDVFEVVNNSLKPEEVYEEYVKEKLGE